MKFDAIVSYYKQIDVIRHCIAGLAANALFLGKVFIVNDETWDEEEIEKIRHMWKIMGYKHIHVVFLDHEHEGFGICKSMNQGLQASKEEYVWLLPADVYAPAGFLAAKAEIVTEHEGEPIMISGPVHHIKVNEGEDIDPDDLGIIRECRFSQLADNPEYARAPWLWMRGANRVVHRPSLVGMGGYDEDFDQKNFEDTELTLRFIINYGPDSLTHQKEPPIYHVNEGTTSPGNRNQRYPYRSAIQLASVMAQCFDYRYNFFAFATYLDPTMLNVGVDIPLPNHNPDWLPMNKVKHISNHAMQRVEYAEQFVKTISTRLAEGGTFTMSPITEEFMTAFAEYGLEVTGLSPDGTVEGFRPIGGLK